jgi:Ca2+-binding EF-hand superfamily protein
LTLPFFYYIWFLSIHSDTKLTEKEIYKLHKQFLDDHPNGRMSMEDTKTMYHHMFPGKNSDTFAEHIFRVYDTG